VAVVPLTVVGTLSYSVVLPAFVQYTDAAVVPAGIGNETVTGVWNVVPAGPNSNSAEIAPLPLGGWVAACVIVSVVSVARAPAGTVIDGPPVNDAEPPAAPTF
jgi:hypothetical protein